MASQICKWNKFSHCRFGRFCQFTHENKKCEESICDGKQCDLRHPRHSRNILQGKLCPFGDFCSFEHNNLDKSATRNQSKNLEKKIEELEKLLKSKDNEMHDLLDTIQALNNVINLTDSENEEEGVTDFETVLERDDGDDNIFDCDECDFVTNKKTGLKIHKSKVHVNPKSNNSYRDFRSKEKINRHIEADNTLNNMCDKVNQKKNLELKELEKENCLGIFSIARPRDDHLPSIFLHSDQCWDLCGHSCPIQEISST